MARKIVITSGKGGVGKTTITANLGISLSMLGLRVALIDIDFGLNNLDLVMGVENKVVYDMLDVLEGRARAKQALVQDNGHKNLYILPSNSLKYSQNISGQNVKLIIDSLAETFDYILIDSPAGIDIGFHRAIAAADEAIVVTTPNISSLRDADKVISIIKSYKLDKISVVVNRARGDLILNDQMIEPTNIEGLLKTKVIGVIPEEDEVFLSSGYGLPPKTRAGKAVKILAQNVEKNTSKLYDTTERYSGIIGSIRRSLRKSV